MNMAKARGRWAAWRRWEDQVIALCGEHHKGLPGEQDAYNERAMWHNYSMGWRNNRRHGAGWRRQKRRCGNG